MSTATTQHCKNNVGMIVDRFWHLIPADHFAHRINPLAMPSPHEHLHALGTEVVKICKSQRATFDVKLSKRADRDAWLRLLGAWVVYYGTRMRNSADLPSRQSIASEIGIEPSSLTNYLNARRPIPLTALKVLCEHMGVKPFDIKPEIGASDAHSNERKLRKSLIGVQRSLDSLIAEASRLKSSDPEAILEFFTTRLEGVKASIAA